MAAEPDPVVPHRLIVIAGSAGSLGPLRTIIESLPSSLDGAVVVLIHRPPDRPSHLVPLLAGRTTLPVSDAQHGEPIRGGHVYVAPPGHRHLRIQGDAFKLTDEPRIRFSRPAADPLFESAAHSFGSEVVAVVLSGMGKNGTAGVAAVKRAGGVVLVQEPTEALHPSMPLHALAAADADLCAPAAELARYLAALCGVDGAPMRISSIR